MTATILDGNVVLEQVKIDLRRRVEALAARGVTVGLGTLLVGNNPASAKYVEMKHRNCAELGITSVHEHLPETATQDDVFAAIDRFNADAGVHAYLMQYPFPGHLDFEAALLRADPAKDVDGLHPINTGLLAQKRPRLRPCTQ